MTIGGMIFPFAQTVDSLLVVNILQKRMAEAGATAAYGLFTGYVSTLINLPIVLGLALGIAVIPQISKGKAERDVASIKQKSDVALKLAFAIGVPFAFLFLTIPDGILRFLYPGITPSELYVSSVLLQISAPSVIALSASQIHTSILQGVGSSYRTVKNMGIGAAVKVILDLVLLPVMGINGVAVASLACFFTTAVLNFLTVRRLMGVERKLYQNSGVILLSGVIMGGVITLVRLAAAGRPALILVSIGGALAYGLMLLAFKAFDESELLSLPFGKSLASFSKFITKG